MIKKYPLFSNFVFSNFMCYVFSIFAHTFEKMDQRNSIKFMYKMKLNVQALHTHTYIIGHYNPSARIIDLVSNNTYVVCVNFIQYRRDLQFKVDSERQTFWETFYGSFNLLSGFLLEICWEQIAEEILFVCRFWCLAWDLNAGFTSNKTTATSLCHTHMICYQLWPF